LCPFPQLAQYKGSGDPNDADNFACVESTDGKDGGGGNGGRGRK
jgi:hypothetical protein